MSAGKEKCMKTLAIGTVLILVAITAMAEETGNKLLSECKETLNDDSQDFFKSGFCLGFVSATADSMEALNLVVGKYAKKHPYCVPAEVTNGQMVRVIVKSLEAKPADLHLNAYFLVVRALDEAWPCPVTK